MSRNLATATSIIPKTAGIRSLGTSVSTLLDTPPSGHVYKIESIIVANIDGTNDCDVTIYWNEYPIGTVTLAKTVTVPADSTLIVTTADTPIYLNYNLNGNRLQGFGSASGDLDVLVSYQDITTSS